MRVERPEEAVALQALPRHRPDDVQLVTELEAEPVVEPEMSHDLLLPVRLVGPVDVGEPIGCRNGELEPLAPGKSGGNGKHA
jgi:hypothetical protein